MEEEWAARGREEGVEAEGGKNSEEEGILAWRSRGGMRHGGALNSSLYKHGSIISIARNKAWLAWQTARQAYVSSRYKEEEKQIIGSE